MTTIAETIGVFQEIADAADAWWRARAEYAQAATSPSYTGQETTAARARFDEVSQRLAAAVERSQDAPAHARGGTAGPASEVTLIEGGIVLAAIAFTHAREVLETAPDGAVAARAEERVERHEADLRRSVRALLDRLAELAARRAA